MISVRLAITELRRISAGRLPRLAILALVLVPTLYGGLYLYANHDPYGRLAQVPAALVVEDQPVTIDQDGTSTEVHAGRDVADQLLDSGDFDWHEVSASEAEEGVEDGTFDFALTVPRDFSAALASSARFDPEQARLVMLTNDANSYLSTTIADQVTGRVRDAVATQVSERAASTFLLGIADTRSSLVDAASGAQGLADGARQARRGARQLAQGATELNDGAQTLAEGATRLDSGLGTLESSTSDLPSQTRQLADGAQQVADGNQQLAGVGDDIAAASRDVRTAYSGGRSDLNQRMQELGLTAQQRREVLQVYDELGATVRATDDDVQGAASQLDRLAAGAGEVAAGAERLAAASPQLAAGIAEAHDGSSELAAGADRLSTGAAALDSGAAELVDGLGDLAPGARRLASGLEAGVQRLPAVDEETRNSVAGTIGDPVAVRDTSRTSAGSYGAGLAPFFLSLATWIGGYVLFLIVRPLSRRAVAANQGAVRVALGGWLAPALIGAVQMGVLLTVVALAVGIEPRNAPGTLAFMLLVSAVFVAIVQMLNAWLGTAGQFLGLVLLVVQLVTAGGTFPWQTIPAPLYPLHHVLPMSYSVDGLRQLMYGGLDSLVVRDALVLACWGLAALALTALAARRQRRWTVSRIQPELTL